MSIKMSDAFREAIALAGTGQGAWISLHSSDPGTTGANELTGGTPAYARKQTTWTGGAADGSVPGSELEFDVPPGPVTHIGCHTAQTGGTFLWSKPLDNSGLVYPGQGKLKLTPTFVAPQGA